MAIKREEGAEAERTLWERYLSSASVPGGTCPDADALAEYLDGRTPEEAREALEAHLAACPECLDAVRDLRASGGIAAREPSPEAPDRARRAPPEAGAAPLRLRSMALRTAAVAAGLSLTCLAGHWLAAAAFARSPEAKRLIAARLDVGLEGFLQESPQGPGPRGRVGRRGP